MIITGPVAQQAFLKCTYCQLVNLPESSVVTLEDDFITAVRPKGIYIVTSRVRELYFLAVGYIEGVKLPGTTSVRLINDVCTRGRPYGVNVNSVGVVGDALQIRFIHG